MSTIFLSYRRQDSADICDRLSDYLQIQYGRQRVFRDVSTILVGSEFPQALRQALEDCRVMVVVIGPGWLDARDAQGRRRLDDPLDWVRIETATALREGKLVIPVLVRGANLPAPQDLPEDLRLLSQCQPVVVRSGPNFREDMEGLFRAVGRTARSGPPHVGLLICAAGTLLALLAFMIAVAVPPLASTETFTVPTNEYLVEVAIALEILRVVGVRHWIWLAVPVTSSVLLIASYAAGLFSLVIILFTLVVLPFVMGTLGPPSSLRPLGMRTHPQWRLLGIGMFASSALALISGSVLWGANTFGLWQVVAGARTQVFDVLAILSFGPLALAWCLLLIYNLIARRWMSFIVWLLAVAVYLPAVMLMLQANIFPIFLPVFQIVILGMGWWVARQMPMKKQTTLPVHSQAPAPYLTHITYR